MIGADALIPRGDSMLIGANPGETVLTKEFTDQLKPTVATLNEFNARMAKQLQSQVLLYRIRLQKWRMNIISPLIIQS